MPSPHVRTLTRRNSARNYVRSGWCSGWYVVLALAPLVCVYVCLVVFVSVLECRTRVIRSASHSSSRTDNVSGYTVRLGYMLFLDPHVSLDGGALAEHIGVLNSTHRDPKVSVMRRHPKLSCKMFARLNFMAPHRRRNTMPLSVTLSFAIPFRHAWTITTQL